MEIEIFEDVFNAHVQRDPFEPFVVKLENAGEVEIRHPESLLIQRDEEEDGSERVVCVYVAPRGRGIHMFEPSAVTRVRDVDPAKAQAS